jgi:hypothetical protein
MRDLEKVMMRHYALRHHSNVKTENNAELSSLEEWAENWVIKKNGRLTISAENEIKQILDELRTVKH